MKRYLPPVAACLCLVCVGCSAADPYDRPGMWQPEGDNASNIAAMAERPFDLIRGRGESTPQIFEGRDAVQRLWQDRARPLSSQAPSSGQAATSSSSGKDTN